MAVSSAEKAFYVGFYIFIWGCTQILIKRSQREGLYNFDLWLVGFNVELCKLALSLGYLFTRAESKGSVALDWADLRAKSHLARFFAVPAVIYSLANFLQFKNIQLLSAPTYRVLINIRILYSGLLLQAFFGKRLTPLQWVALVLLLLGCTTEQLGSFNLAQGGVLALVLISIQALCSSFGGVYFQWLLQTNTDAANPGLVEKNIFLYSWGCLVTLFMAALMSPQALTTELFWSNYSWDAAPIILSSAIGGMTTSLLLRHLDVVAKEYANAGEMLFVAIVSHHLFGTPLSFYLVGGMALVIISVVMYNKEETRVAAEQRAAKEAANAVPLAEVKTAGAFPSPGHAVRDEADAARAR
jgi:UDP-sugar transporter A1/2/3